MYVCLVLEWKRIPPPVHLHYELVLSPLPFMCWCPPWQQHTRWIFFFLVRAVWKCCFSIMKIQKRTNSTFLKQVGLCINCTGLHKGMWAFVCLSWYFMSILLQQSEKKWLLWEPGKCLTHRQENPNFATYMAVIVISSQLYSKLGLRKMGENGEKTPRGS